jgi:5-methylcytosine-specific restriction endonuclease McrA
MSRKPRPNEFLRRTQLAALDRQKHRCALCGEKISALGHAGQITHSFGEGAHAHHMRHVKQGGSNALDNCVILCWSCHYSAHEGGNYRHSQIDTTASDYPHFNG